MRNLIIILATIFFSVSANAQITAVTSNATVAYADVNKTLNAADNNSSTESCSSEEKMNLKVFQTNYDVNKFTKTLKLNMKSPSTNYAIVNVIDVMGRKVFSARMNVSQGFSTNELDLSNCSKGLYNLQIITDASIKNFRIVI
jgi:hypothetical protein